MKVAHLSVLRSHRDGAGVTNQLRMEYEAARLSSLSWKTELWDDEKTSDTGLAFLSRLPFIYRSFIGRRYFIYKRTKLLLMEYDYVLVRYTLLHIFDLMQSRRDAGKIIYVFHLPAADIAKTLPRFLGFIFLYFELLISKKLFRKNVVFSAVTSELYQKYSGTLNLKNKKHIVYPNGALSLTHVEDARQGIVKIGFIASRFYEWIGLTELLGRLRGIANTSLTVDFCFFIVGEITEDQRQCIAELNQQKPGLINYAARVSGEAMPQFLATLHCTLGAFAMNKSGLRASASLKVRESLMAGVPVYTGHPDAHIPEDFKYLKVGECDPEKIIRFAKQHAFIARKEVQELARPYIDKKLIMQRFIDELKTI